MRGGFVACAGGGADVSNDLERIAGCFRAHSGQLSFHDVSGFRVALLNDPTDGPELASVGGRVVIAHGAAAAPFAELIRGSGRFAAAEWDGRVVRAARDPLGLAALFYRTVGDCLWLATEVAPLCAIRSTTPDLTALAAAAAFIPSDEDTGWIGIRRVLPGHTLEIGPDHRPLSSRYWNPVTLLGSYRGGRGDAEAQFAERLQAAVEGCCGPSTGILLSGGIDSSAVALAAGRHGHRLHLVHVRFPENLATDEEPFAQEVADALGSPLHCVAADLDPWDPRSDLDMLGIPYQRFPFGTDEPALAHLSARGIRVALDGHDADGLLGYSAGEWGALATSGQFRRVAALARRQGAWPVARRVAADLVPPWARPCRRRRGAAPFMQSIERYFDRTVSRPMRETDVHRWRPPQARWRITQLLPVSPRASVSFEWNELQAASFGVDLRHPFANRDVLELLVSLPMSIKSEPGRTKGILRDAMADWLPASVRQRPKTDHSRTLEHRVDKARCLEWIQASGARLPHLNYRQLYSDAESGIEAMSVYLLVNLARLHVFASAPAPPSGTSTA